MESTEGSPWSTTLKPCCGYKLDWLSGGASLCKPSTICLWIRHKRRCALSVRKLFQICKPLDSFVSRVWREFNPRMTTAWSPVPATVDAPCSPPNAPRANWAITGARWATLINWWKVGLACSPMNWGMNKHDECRAIVCSGSNTTTDVRCSHSTVHRKSTNLSSKSYKRPIWISAMAC